MIDFYVGQSVMCIDDSGQDERTARECGGRVRFGAVYVIRDIVNSFSGGRVVVGVHLEGIHGVIHTRFGLRLEHAWRPERFTALRDEPIEVARETEVAL